MDSSLNLSSNSSHMDQPNKYFVIRKRNSFHSAVIYSSFLFLVALLVVVLVNPPIMDKTTTEPSFTIEEASEFIWKRQPAKMAFLENSLHR